MVLKEAGFQKNKEFESINLFQTLDYFMLRIPILPVEMYIDAFVQKDIELQKLRENGIEHLAQLANNPVIREAIAVASLSLLKSLPNIKGDNPRKMEQTIKGFLRYLLRMSTRPTPFGLCAGVTYGVFGENTEITIDSLNCYRKRTRPDMEWLFKFIKDIEENIEVVKQLEVCTNSAVFYNGSRAKLPYVTRYGQQALTKRLNMESISIRATPVVRQVLERANKPVRFEILLEQIEKEYPNTPTEKIEQFLWQLFQQEFLISELRPPLVIFSPLSFIINKLKNIKGIDESKQKLHDISERISDYDEIQIGRGEAAFLDLVDRMKNVVDVKNPLQVDLSISSKKVVLNREIGADVEKAAECLWRLSPEFIGNPHFRTYRNDFIERYGTNREVPLLELLDEDLGLGAPPGYEYPQSHRQLGQQIRPYSEKREHLLLQWVSKAIINKELEIEITEDMIKQLEPVPPVPEEAPLSLELYFTIAAKSKKAVDDGDYRLILGANPGSPGAGKSFGRFVDILGDHFTDYLAQIHNAEQFQRQNRIFAELVYLPSAGRAANVVLSKNFRPYEIVLGTNSAKDETRTIPLSDLVIGSTTDYFYLKSIKLNKEVIPTTGHMLNFSAAPNIYRFLRELAMERQRNWGAFYWGALEKSPMLPRLRYGKTILSPARWNLSKYTSPFDTATTEEEWFSALNSWRKEWNVPAFVYQTVADNRILLNLEHPLHVDEFRKDFLKLKEDEFIEITEMGTDFSENFVGGPDGHYIMECVFPIVRQSSVKRNIEPISFQTNPITKYAKKLDSQQRGFFPGSNWLYLKLYSPQSRQEEFIGWEMEQFCKKVQQQELVEHSFFIRYADPEHHIRLRFKGEPNILIRELMPRIYTWALKLKREGILSRLAVDTYEPEIERYGGPEVIEMAERLFSADSAFVSHLIGLKRSGKIQMDLDMLGVISTIDLMENLDISFEEQINWFNSMISHKEFAKEFHKERKAYLSVVNPRNNWGGLRNNADGANIFPMLQMRRPIIHSYAESMRSCRELLNHPMDIMGSIIHMNLNRLLGVDREREHKIMAFTQQTLHSYKYFGGTGV